MKKCFHLILISLIGYTGISQIKERPLDSIAEKMIIVEGDSLFQQSIALEEVYIFGRLEFSSYQDKLKYYILRRKTFRVYPYAKMASERLEELNDSLLKIKSKRKKKKYTKQLQKFIEGEFSEELKKLTRTEGQILVKLIYRQTGNTTYGLVKELRSGWRAFWYNTTAKMFKINLKEEYHPESIHEDYLIEDILQRAFAASQLVRQESVLDYDYSSLTNRWGKTEKKKK